MGHLAGFGCYLPSQELTNDELAREFALRLEGAEARPLRPEDSQWIIDACGFRTRRIAAPDETVAVMGARAAAQAMESAGLATPGAIIVGSGTPDRQFPGISAAIQKMLGAVSGFAFDIHLASVGGFFALAAAHQMCERYGPILVVGTDKMSEVMARPPRSKETAILFGDGAGALVVAPGPGSCEIVNISIQSQGVFADDLSLEFGDTLHMNGRSVILHAHRRLTECIQALLRESDLTVDDVGLWLFHQANLVLLSHIGKTLKIPPERVFINGDRYGNTSAASVLIATAEAHQQGRMQSGYAVMAAFGAGISWGAALLKIS